MVFSARSVYAARTVRILSTLRGGYETLSSRWGVGGVPVHLARRRRSD